MLLVQYSAVSGNADLSAPFLKIFTKNELHPIHTYNAYIALGKYGLFFLQCQEVSNLRGDKKVFGSTVFSFLLLSVFFG